jgi:hypothetical protein
VADEQFTMVSLRNDGSLDTEFVLLLVWLLRDEPIFLKRRMSTEWATTGGGGVRIEERERVIRER